MTKNIEVIGYLFYVNLIMLMLLEFKYIVVPNIIAFYKGYEDIKKIKMRE